jgi:hypothetical protein
MKGTRPYIKTWSVALREGHGLRELRRLFGPKREEVRGGQSHLHNERLHNSSFSPNDKWVTE